MSLAEYIFEKAANGLLSWSAELEAAEQFRVTIREVDEAALKADIMPGRYSRNLPALSVQEQYRLFQSQVAVVGCGGLGGYIIEELSRIGVGIIKAIDYDVFEEHNLNRQLLSQPSLIGHSKARAAAERVNTVNPAVIVNACTEKLEMVKAKVPMPDFMAEQLPDLMPNAIADLMPKMLPEILPHFMPLMIDYLMN